MNDHPDFDTLSDLASGGVPDDASSETARHVTVCTACATELAELRELLGRTTRLPRAIEPPESLWADVRASIERDTPARDRTPHATLSWWKRPSTWMLAAASLVLVAASSAITAVLVRRATPVSVVAVRPDEGHPASLPAAMALVEAGYDDTARQLEATLALQRNRLAPTTISTVEHSLAVIDAAIAEARQALLEDPANRALMDIYTANYEHKLELLRRATELTSTL